MSGLCMMDNKENLGMEQGVEVDELAGPSKRARVTPRNSIATKASPAPKPTPHANVSLFPYAEDGVLDC